MTNEDAGGTVETPTIDELTTQLTAEKEARAKAEAKIVDMKKTSKETKSEVNKETVKSENFMTREDYAAEEFFKANNDLVEHKETLTELVSKGNSWEDAKFLLERKDPTIANRKIANQTNFTAWEPANLEKTSFTQDELKGLSQIEYNKVMSLKEQGKVQFT